MHRTTSHPCIIAGCLALALPLAACSTIDPDQPSPDEQLAEGQSTSVVQPASYRRSLPWGMGPGELRLRPRAPEMLAMGPNAVALTPSGHSLVLDRLAGRVVEIGAEGMPRTVASVEADAEDLLVGPSGSFAAFSPVRARAWFFNPDGTTAGELEVPRALHMLQTLSIGPSRQLLMHNGYQETMNLGSPSAPTPLAMVLHSKREGAAFLPDGRGLACHVQDDDAELWVIEQADVEREKPVVTLRHKVPGEARAARIVGAEGSTVCMRLEQVESNPTVRVERRAVCMNALTGQVLLDKDLPPPGLYLPRTELAMGAGRLAFIHPIESGLGLRSWTIPAVAGAAREVQP